MLPRIKAVSCASRREKPLWMFADPQPTISDADYGLGKPRWIPAFAGMKSWEASGTKARPAITPA